MKYAFSFSLLMGLFNSTISAKEIQIEGLIIRKLDTLEVTFTIPITPITKEVDFEPIQYELLFKGADGNTMKVKANQAQEIRFSYNNSEIRMLSRNNFLSEGLMSRSAKSIENYPKIFLKLEIDGRLKLFSYYRDQTVFVKTDPISGIITGSNSIKSEQIVIQKEMGELVVPPILGFKNDMANYFNDCPPLKAKVESQEFQRQNIVAIVDFYNSDCGL